MKASESSPWEFTSPVTDDSIIRCPRCKEMSLLQDWKILKSHYMACPRCMNLVCDAHVDWRLGIQGYTLQVCDNLFTDVCYHGGGSVSAKDTTYGSYFDARLVSTDTLADEMVNDLLQWLVLKARR